MRNAPAPRPRVSISFWTIALFLGAAAASTSLFMITQNVQLREQRIAALNETLLNEQQKTRILDAEWAYLSRPQRLEGLMAARAQATANITPASGEADAGIGHKMYLASTSAMPPAPTPITTIVEPAMNDGFDTPPPEDELKKVSAQTPAAKAAPAKTEVKPAEAGEVDTTSPAPVDEAPAATPAAETKAPDTVATDVPEKTGVDDAPAVTDAPTTSTTDEAVTAPVAKTEAPATEVKAEETAEKPKTEAAPKEKETPKAKPKAKPKPKPAPKKVDKNDEPFPIARLNKKQAVAPSMPKPQPLSAPRHGGVARPILE